MTHCEEVIITHEKRGLGTDKDPVRKILQVWSKEGQLIAEELDRWKDEA